MPWPDFTELTFGYTFLREFEKNHVHGGKFPKAPDFISPAQEAKDGYDVEVAIDAATPVFIQLKRSYVLVRSNAKEIQDGYYVGPRVYRMHLHKNNNYRQHRKLQDLEAKGNIVLYVTSQIYTNEEFADAYDNETIVSDASAIFAPSEIVLPDHTKDHHVSFKETDTFGYIYSREPHFFERKFVSLDNWLPTLLERRQGAASNRKNLSQAVKSLVSELPDRDPLRIMIAEKTVEQQASILAYFLLDSHLTFFKE